jgi:uncharacterized membrane protein (UPF0127 family)
MHDLHYQVPKGARRKYVYVLYTLIFIVALVCGFSFFNFIYRSASYNDAAKPGASTKVSSAEDAHQSIQQSLQQEYQNKQGFLADGEAAGAESSAKGGANGLAVGTPVLDLGDYKMLVSDTDYLREKGLGGRAGLDKKEAMLFVFGEDSKHYFWMKDMQFSIDMVWLDKDKKVIGIEKSASPDTYPEAFGPKVDSRYVLEFNSGTADSVNLHVGDEVKF